LKENFFSLTVAVGYACSFFSPQAARFWARGLFSFFTPTAFLVLNELIARPFSPPRPIQDGHFPFESQKREGDLFFFAFFTECADAVFSIPSSAFPPVF